MQFVIERKSVADQLETVCAVIKHTVCKDPQIVVWLEACASVLWGLLCGIVLAAVCVCVCVYRFGLHGDVI